MSFTLTLAVGDLELTELFYREILQMPLERFVPAEGHPPVLLLQRGDAVVLFRAREVLEALHPAVFQHLDRHPVGTGMTLEFTLDDLRPVRRALERRGLHPVYEMEDAEFDREEMWLHDPDGYLVVVLREPLEDEE